MKSFLAYCILLTLSFALTAQVDHEQSHEHHGEECYHPEFELAHHHLEIAYVLTQFDYKDNQLIQSGSDPKLHFTTFFRLLSIVQAKYPDHHLEEDFYDKSIEVANRLNNIGATAYLSKAKEKMLKAKFGDDYLTRHCHCGKCVKHVHGN